MLQQAISHHHLSAIIVRLPHLKKQNKNSNNTTKGSRASTDMFTCVCPLTHKHINMQTNKGLKRWRTDCVLAAFPKEPEFSFQQ